jgi:uncharacterized protein (DUF1697 family)
VEAFATSGNIIFDGDAEDLAGLERAIEQMLLDALGYDLATFIRTDVDVRAIARHTPFMPASIKAAAALKVAMFKDTLDEKETRAVLALKTKNDEFHVRGRELYWLSWAEQSALSNAVFEVAVGRPSALRGMNTITQLAKKYRPRAFEGPNG